MLLAHAACVTPGMAVAASSMALPRRHPLFHGHRLTAAMPLHQEHRIDVVPEPYVAQPVEAPHE